MSDIAVLYDSFDTIGGGEYVAVTMAKIFNTPIYTSTKTTNFYDDKVEIVPLVKERTNNYVLREIRSGRAFKNLKLEHKVVLSSGDKVKFYEPQNGQNHINYTHTPQRMFYDLKPIYRQKFGFYRSIPFELFGFYWRKSIERALNNINKLLCISEVVRERIKKYWNVDAEIIHSPVETFKYKCKTSERYFLYISRLNSIKRTDIVLDTFNRINDKLVVVGKDEEGFEGRMKRMVNVDYKEEISEEEKIDLLAHCAAVIYPPMAEDFGLVPIEAFASGKPVIGVKEGFTRYQIKPYVNGLFVDRPTPLGLEKALKEFRRCCWDIKEIQDFAKKYDVREFRKKIKEAVKENGKKDGRRSKD